MEWHPCLFDYRYPGGPSSQLQKDAGSTTSKQHVRDILFQITGKHFTIGLSPMHGCVTGRLGLRWGRGKTGWEGLDAVGRVPQIAGLEGSGTLDFPTDGSISDGAPLAAASRAVSGKKAFSAVGSMRAVFGKKALSAAGSMTGGLLQFESQERPGAARCKRETVAV